MTWSRIGMVLGLAVVVGGGLGYLHAQATLRAVRNGRDVARCTAEGGAWSWERSVDDTVIGTCVPRLLLPGRFGR